MHIQLPLRHNLMVPMYVYTHTNKLYTRTKIRESMVRIAVHDRPWLNSSSNVAKSNEL